jgi:riboflavin synthase
MFTGLIESTGIIKSRSSGKTGKLVIAPKKIFNELCYGESIAVNGACLTLEKVLPDGNLEFHFLGETFSRTNLGNIAIGGCVNLERALRMGDRIGGHLVTGHIDTTAPLISLSRNVDDYQLKIAMPEGMEAMFVEKGSIAVDGISLTLSEVTPSSFTVCLIPVTMNETALITRKVNDLLNLETDLLGKYILKQMSLSKPELHSNVTIEKLKDAGW